MREVTRPEITRVSSVSRRVENTIRDVIVSTDRGYICHGDYVCDCN